LILLLFSSKVLFSQNLEERTYLEVVKSGMGTAPSLVVIKIKDLNTDVVKEVCTDVPSLFWSAIRESKGLNDKEIDNILVSHSVDRTFEFAKPDVLDRMNFNTYKLTNEDEIIKIITEKHLIDSLSSLDQLRKTASDKYYEYADNRDDILDTLTDVIEAKRPLLSDEKKVVKILQDHFSEYYYDKSYKGLNGISKQAQALLKAWEEKVLPYKTAYIKAEKELNRITNKFVDTNIKKYGLSFCHVAFRYGAIFYYGDINPKIGFGKIVK
jgi:hypothetical protein